jgi:hypothetical protein
MADPERSGGPAEDSKEKSNAQETPPIRLSTTVSLASSQHEASVAAVLCLTFHPQMTAQQSLYPRSEREQDQEGLYGPAHSL